MENKNTVRITLGIILLGAMSRLLPHPPNVTPLTAMALLGGASLMSRKQALLAPLAALLLSDLLLGLHATLPFVYACFAATTLMGSLLKDDRSAGRLVGACLASSVLFFVVTNFGAWLVMGIYPRSLAGLAACYTAAIPFFRNAVFGDLAFTAALFGLERLSVRALRPATAAA
jgi:hypothetical protein